MPTYHHGLLLSHAVHLSTSVHISLLCSRCSIRAIDPHVRVFITGTRTLVPLQRSRIAISTLKESLACFCWGRRTSTTSHGAH
jgi:hypothetical protein